VKRLLRRIRFWMLGFGYDRDLDVPIVHLDVDENDAPDPSVPATAAPSWPREVVPDYGLGWGGDMRHHFREAWSRLAADGHCGPVDSACYRRILKFYLNASKFRDSPAAEEFILAHVTMAGGGR
jgi:hypothetical protein